VLNLGREGRGKNPGGILGFGKKKNQWRPQGSYRMKIQYRREVMQEGKVVNGITYYKGQGSKSEKR
jgi:hypothetical protein